MVDPTGNKPCDDWDKNGQCVVDTSWQNGKGNQSQRDWRNDNKANDRVREDMIEEALIDAGFYPEYDTSYSDFFLALPGTAETWSIAGTCLDIIALMLDGYAVSIVIAVVGCVRMFERTTLRRRLD
jgi:hypothetical protein